MSAELVSNCGGREQLSGSAADSGSEDRVFESRQERWDFFFFPSLPESTFCADSYSVEIPVILPNVQEAEHTCTLRM